MKTSLIALSWSEDRVGGIRGFAQRRAGLVKCVSREHHTGQFVIFSTYIIKSVKKYVLPRYLYKCIDGFFSVILYVFIREPSRTDSSFMSKHSWHLYIDLGDMLLDNTLGIM